MRGDGAAVEAEQMKLRPVCRIHEDTPLRIHLCVIVLLDEVRDGGARVLDLLVAIRQRVENDRTVGDKSIFPMMPIHDTRDTSRL